MQDRQLLAALHCNANLGTIGLRGESDARWLAIDGGRNIAAVQGCFLLENRSLRTSLRALEMEGANVRALHNDALAFSFDAKNFAHDALRGALGDDDNIALFHMTWHFR